MRIEQQKVGIIVVGEPGTLTGKFVFVVAMVAGCFSSSQLRGASQPIVIATSEKVQRVVVGVDPKTGQLSRRTIWVSRPQVVAKPLAAIGRSVAKSFRPPPHLQKIAKETAIKHRVDPELVQSVIRHESAFNPMAISPVGAMGLMQLMPQTARRFGVVNPFDPQQNIEGGVRYLKYLQSLYGENLDLTLAAYNAGEGAVQKYGNQVPPYRETVYYVAKVGQTYRASQRPSAVAKLPKISEPEAKTAAAVPTVSPNENQPAPQPFEVLVDSDGRMIVRTRSL
jgi:hypothetical protein